MVVLRKDGKAICTNVKSMEEVEKVFGGFIEELKRAGWRRRTWSVWSAVMSFLHPSERLSGEKAKVLFC
ncbi:hypothetical protein B6U83_03120 [Thermoplasmatales archaeon ex4484_36]|nr:MAG: hypothetical protein B6U83_03120 [Thermoplasmatales archaeon ex4484_36]